MKKIFITTLYLMLSIAISAQIPGLPNNLLSPNASSLGEYGEVPVSLYTGVPDIKIPLYTIELGEYNLPITMSYHAGGIRPDQHVGWTGLGWTLNAGGCISRVVNGIADEYHNPNNYTSERELQQESGFYYRHSAIEFNWDDSDALKDSINLFFESPALFASDTSPDKFSFNFLDYHGNFYLNTSGQWQVQCNKPVKVVFENDFTTQYAKRSDSFIISGTNISEYGRSHSFSKFTIIGDDGTKYIFGNNDDAIEYSMDFFNQDTSPFIASTWYLTKIIYPNKREITFSYDRGDFIAQMYCYIEKSAVSGQTSQYSCSYSGPSNLDMYQGQLILPSYLSKITFPYGEISFSHSIADDLKYDFDRINAAAECNYSSPSDTPSFMPILRYNGNYDKKPLYPNCLEALKWWKLTEMVIKKADSSPLKRFLFDYNEVSTERLTLKSITETGGNSSTLGRVYGFDYTKVAELPTYVSNQVDHWGFYCGRDADYDLSLPISAMATKYSESREPNIEVAQYGVLSQINYPTGGFTRFVYEPHDYQKQVNDYRTGYESVSTKMYAGGLRIKRIVSSSTGLEQDTCTMKQYYYVSDFLKNKNNASSSSGILCQRASYYFGNHTVPNYYSDGEYIISAFCSKSILPFSDNTNGTHIGYSQVIEQNADGSFSIYNFSNFDTGAVDSACDVSMQDHTIYEPYSSRDQERGLLLSKINYDSNYNKTSCQYYSYGKDCLDSDFVKTISVNAKTYNCGSTLHKTYEITACRNHIYSMRMTTCEDSVFLNGKSFVSTTQYDYNDQRLLSRISKTAHNRTTERTTYKYPHSFINDTIGRYKEMCDSNRLNQIIECVVDRINIAGIVYPIKKTFYHYNDNIVKPSKIDEAHGNGEYETVYSFLFDKYYNIYYKVYCEGFLGIWYIWSYNGLYPVAIIEEPCFSDIINIIGDYNSYAELSYPDTSKLDELRKKSSQSNITCYQYEPLLGVTKKTDSSGITTHYIYDDLGRLKLIKDTSGDVLKEFDYNYSR